MLKTEKIEFGEGKVHQLVFSSMAIRELESLSGHSTQVIGLMIVTGRAGYGLLQEALYCSLEGARVKHRLNIPPFTLEGVGDMIDEYQFAGMTGLYAFWDKESPALQSFLRAWDSAFPLKQREETKDPNPPQASEENTTQNIGKS